ncbi:MAG: hypothetical protein COB07_08810 [Sulfurovum sp.]|nr:MAG: hypothetical protein COB07_08810 [Sulfurovum sp.]
MKLNTKLLSTFIALLLLTACGPTSNLNYSNGQLSIQLSDQNLQLQGKQLKQNRENFSILFLRQSLLRLNDGNIVMYEDARTDLQYQFDPTTTRLISAVFDAKNMLRVYAKDFLYAYQIVLPDNRILNLIASQSYEQELQMVYGMSTKKLNSMLKKLDENAQPAYYQNVIDLSQEPNPLMSRWTTKKINFYPLVIPLRRIGGR